MAPKGSRLHCSTCVCFLLVAVCGCLPTEEAEVARYRSLLDSGVPPVEIPAANKPLRLAVAMSIANQRSEQLALRGEDFVQAIILERRIREGFLPTLSIQPTFTIQDRPSGSASSSTG